MVGLVALMLFSVIWSIQRAGWSDSLFILTPITLGGMLAGLLLSKIRGVPRLLLHMTGMMAGVALVLWETANLSDDPNLLTIQDRVQDLLSRLVLWVQAVTVGGASDDLQLFLLSLAVLAWVLSYSSTWFVFRARWLWWAIVPNGVALVVNISYASAQLGWYFILFLMSVLLLMVRFNMLLHEERWERERVNYSPSLRWNFLRASSFFALIVAVVMWYMPTQPVNSTLSHAWEQINGPWEDLQDRWSRAFATVNGTGNFGYATFNDSFTLGGALNLGDTVAFKVRSDYPLRWRARTLDSFDGRTWKDTSPATFKGRNVSPRLSLEANQQLPTDDNLRRAVTVTIQMVHPVHDNILLAPLRPISVSVSTRLGVPWQDLNEVYQIPGTNPSDAPIELQPLLTLFADARRAALQTYGRDPANPTQGGEPLPQGRAEDVARAVLAQVGQDGAISTEIGRLQDRGIVASYFLRNDFTFVVRANGQVPIYDDLNTVYSTDRLQPGEDYSVESMVSQADEQTLRQAGTNYPDWVRNRYLELPRDLPVRVIEKAHEVVDQAGASNPYDTAIALQNFLRTYNYNTKIDAPPPGRDAVDYFLFDSKQGYCTYYSSAMVVMLRALGIPAREAIGYAPGDYDSTTREWVVRESASHAWPEVYFPGAGWLEFEPTPSQSVIQRPASPEDVNATPTPFVPTPPGAVATRHALDDESPTPTGGGGAALNTQGGLGSAITPWTLLLLPLIIIAVLLLRYWLERQAVANGRLVLGGLQYYERLVKLAWWLGIRPRPYDTPYEFADQVSEEVPNAGPYVKPIARAYVQERFGRHRPDRTEQQELAQVWARLRAALLRRMSEARRLLQRR
jgi:transglutaminase-like putative cysteine protease